MPAYEENQPKKYSAILLLIIAFLLIYSPFQISSWQLRHREERYAAIANEMNVLHPNTIIHGELISLQYPMYPLLVALVHKTGLSLEFCLRIVSIASLALLSIIAWEADRKSVV